jgi:hypothetical protein
VSELVVDLADETSVELAWQVLKLVRTDHTVAAADRSKPELPPWEADTPAATQAVASAESAAEPSEPDPWAVSAQNRETPAATTTAPSAPDDDDEDPWS